MGGLFRIFLALALLLSVVGPVAAQAPDAATARAGDAWRTLAITDLDALYANVRAIHPGYRAPETPDFSARVDSAYRTARGRAEAARSYLDWRAATLGFMLSFRDGHTIYRLNATPSRVRWPGFLIDGRGGGYVVRTPDGVSDVDADAPQGARVLSCDGVPIETLLRQRLDGVEADWSKPPERIRQAYRLLIDYHTVGAAPMTACRIEDATGARDLTLRWRVETWATLAPGLAAFNRERERPIAQRVLPDGGRWISLGSFGDEGALTALNSALETQNAALRSAPYVVLDLRGNRGGNSGWGTTLANTLWGEAAVTAKVARVEAGLPTRGGKFWRASAETAAQARKTAAEFDAMGPSMAGPAGYFRDVAALISAAPKGDRALVEDPCCTPASTASADLPPLVAPATTQPVYLLTDAGCFSSCILALAPLRAMGAIVVGETTGQNEEYGEVAGPIMTPSGLARALIPMSIIRQRPDMLVVSPDRPWSGAMDDDAGIAAWIAAMARPAPR